jgi:hypothetical protein
MPGRPPRYLCDRMICQNNKFMKNSEKSLIILFSFFLCCYGGNKHNSESYTYVNSAQINMIIDSTINYHMAVLDSGLSWNYENDHILTKRIDSSMAFIENISGIKALGDHSYVFTFKYLTSDFQKWVEWLKANRQKIGWDSIHNCIIIKKSDSL